MKTASLLLFFTLVSLLLGTASIVVMDARAEDAPESLSVAGLSLMSNTPYTVYLEPAAICEKKFTPVYVTMEFESANYCLMTCEGQQVAMGRFTNDKYINLFSVENDLSERLACDGKCDTDCESADFAVRVTYFEQGEEAIPVFGEQTTVVNNTTEPFEEEQEETVVFLAGTQTITQGETYSFLIIPDDSCDKEFKPFILPIKFLNELGAYFVTSQYKNVSSAYPATYYREDSGWIEFSTMSGKFWGMVEAGRDGADLAFLVVGLEDNPANLFEITAFRKGPEPEPEPEPEIPSLDLDVSFYYYYGMLDSEEQTVYAQLLEAMTAYDTEITLAYPVSNEDFNRIFWWVLYDNPQIFWTDRRYRPSINDQNLVTKATLYYNELVDNIENEQAKVDAAVEKYLSGAKGMKPLEAERYVHDRLVTETTYVAGCPHNQNIYSLLVYGETVCAGYARAFQYIMQKLGIPCYYCTGITYDSDGNEGRHAWNVIRVDGDWYNVDVTWDDWYREEGEDYDYISYEFYNVTDRFLSEEHARNIDSALFPACDATRDSFERIYGHDWQTEIANAGGLRTVASLNDYYQLCYDSLVKNGVGTVKDRFIVTNAEAYDRILHDPDDKGFVNGFMKRYFKKAGLGRNAYYDFDWTSFGLGTRGNCFCIDLTQTITVY